MAHLFRLAPHEWYRYLISVVRRTFWALAAASWGACSSEESLPPPPAASATSGASATGLATGGSAGTAAIGSAGPGGACEIATPGAGSDGDSGGFKFDVGPSGGGSSGIVTCDDAASRRTNLGCTFFAVDLPNDPRGTIESPPAADQQFAIAVGNPSGLTAALVEVYLTGDPNPVATQTIEPGDTFTFELPSQSINPETTSTDGLAYRVQSDIPVTAYQFNPLDNVLEVYSNDASLLLPDHALGKKYTAVTGNAILLGMALNDPNPINAGAFVAVVATRDDTTVDFEPTADLVGSIASPVTLDRGQVANIVSTQANGDGNLSGTRVTADGPIAVFSGNMATAVPAGLNVCCADHLEHQLSPHEAWGSRYVVAPPPAPSGDGDDPAVYRMTALFNKTQLEYCPERPAGAPSSISAGETAVFATDMPFSVRAVDPDHTFSVTQFLQSAEAIGENRPGDPAMLVLPAAAQFERQFAFVVPAGYVENHVTIIARGESGDVRLDGKLVNGWSDLAVLDGLYHRYAQVSLDAGQHSVESQTEVAVSVFGYDNAVSFGYPGGAALRVISVPPAG